MWFSNSNLSESVWVFQPLPLFYLSIFILITHFTQKTTKQILQSSFVNHFFTLSIFSIAYQIVNSFECSHTSIFVFTNWNQQQIQYFLLMNDWTYFRRLLLSIHISSRTNNIHNTLNRFSINSRSVAVSGSRLLHRDNKTRKRSKIS
mgnify:CR=1 FL=1